MGFWKKPPASVYSISVQMYAKRGTREATVPFRAQFKREGETVLSQEGAVGTAPGQASVEVYRFTVDEDGDVFMGTVGSPMPAPVAAPAPIAAAAPVAVAKVKAKAKVSAKAWKAAATKHVKERTALAIKN